MLNRILMIAVTVVMVWGCCMLLSIGTINGNPILTSCVNAQESQPHKRQYNGIEELERSKPSPEALKELSKLKPPLLKVKKLPKIGDVLRELPKTQVHELTDSAGGSPSYGMKVDGNLYTIAVSKQDGAVCYIATKAAGFRTPEGFSMKDAFGDLLAKYPKGKRVESGWGTYVVLPSGWAGAVFDMKRPDAEPAPTTKIMWFFKRDRDMPPKMKKSVAVEQAKAPKAKVKSQDADKKKGNKP